MTRVVILSSSHSPKIDNKLKSLSLPTGRDKFDGYESPLMPLPIPVWHDALKVVKWDEPPASYNTRYLFPEAAIFASTNEARHAKFFATWNVFRPACILRVFSSESSASPCPVNSGVISFLMGFWHAATSQIWLADVNKSRPSLQMP